MSNEKKQPGRDPDRNNQVDSTESSSKKLPPAKVTEAQNGEEEPRPGNPAPRAGEVRDHPSKDTKHPPGRDVSEERSKKRHHDSPSKV